MSIEIEAEEKEFWHVKRLVRMALFIALGAVGGLIPLPSPTGTVGLDSAPGYFLALFAGGVEGAIVLGVGHVVSSLKAGFPLGPIHIPIAIMMGGCGLLFAFLAKQFNLIAAAVVGTLVNGVIISALLIPWLGMGLFVGLTPMLLVASTVNILIAILIYRIFERAS